MTQEQVVNSWQIGKECWVWHQIVNSKASHPQTSRISRGSTQGSVTITCNKYSFPLMIQINDYIHDTSCVVQCLNACSNNGPPCTGFAWKESIYSYRHHQGLTCTNLTTSNLVNAHLVGPQSNHLNESRSDCHKSCCGWNLSQNS